MESAALHHQLSFCSRVTHKTKDKQLLIPCVSPEIHTVSLTPFALPTINTTCANSMSIRMSTINDLPFELLGHIFSLATHGEEHNSYARYTHQRSLFDTESVKMPILLSCVSRYWRSVAQNTPALWTSLCITQEMVVEHDTGDYCQTYLDTTFLEHYLSHSQQYPLDILIDARDPSWNLESMSEPEAPFDLNSEGQAPTFSSTHIMETLHLLVPHLHRWRSFEVLTDIWAPMYTALECINPFIVAHGAPRLESLYLGRCNEYPSYSPEFHPKAMKGPSLFTSQTELGNILPSLRYLKLQGVHVEWSALGEIFSQRGDTISLASLELDFHSRDVRPSLEEFHQLLSSNPHLQTLSISGSGPLVTDMDDDATLVHLNIQPVQLSKLKALTLGYRNISECQTVLEILSAPNVQTLTLEDGTHLGDPEDVDSSSILSYLGTGEFQDTDNYKFSSNTQPIFPGLTSVSLSALKTKKDPVTLNVFLNSSQRLQTLEVSKIGMEEVIGSLAPRPSTLNSLGKTIICPCPKLQSLVIKNIDTDGAVKVYYEAESLQNARLNWGATQLNFDVQISEFDDEDMDIDIDMEEMEESEFRDGGVFNDAEFDRCYTAAALQYR